MSYQPEHIPFITGMDPGMGVNMVTGQPTSLVFPNLKTTTAPATGFTLDELCIQTAADYASLLEVVGKAEGQAWTEGGQVSVSASGQYLREQDFSEQTLAFVLHRTAVTVSELPTGPQLDDLQLPPAVAQRILSDPAGFLDEYGTHVIAGFLYGGSFVGSILIQSVSQSDKQQVDAAMSTAINDFDAGKGSVDASFKQDLLATSQKHQVKVDASGNGVDPPAFTPENVDAMQGYVDNQFVKDLGTGNQVIAVCYPWETLPCIANLAGYEPGSLSPAIDTGVLLSLRDEYRQEVYAAQTAESMQATDCWVSNQSAQDLEDDLVALNEAQGKIDDLTFDDLQALDQASVQPYLVATQYLNDLTAIANGRALVSWELNLDAAFTPNTQSYPDATQPGASVAFPASDGSPTIVLQADHGDGMLNCGFVYKPAANLDPQSTLQEQVSLQAYLNFTDAVYLGTADMGTVADRVSVAQWEDYAYDHIGVWFGP